MMQGTGKKMLLTGDGSSGASNKQTATQNSPCRKWIQQTEMAAVIFMTGLGRHQRTKVQGSADKERLLGLALCSKGQVQELLKNFY